MRAVLGSLLVTAGLAGCIGGDETGLEPSDAALAPLSLPDSFEFLCPAGETRTTAEGLCVGTIASLTESNQEPFLAVDPNRPGVMAVGVNAGYSTDAVDPARQDGAELIAMDVFFTQDGGATWTRSQLPYIAAPSGMVGLDLRGVGDPALQFDEAGVLHVSGIATNAVLTSGWEIFYTSSPDLGDGWTEPVLFTEDGSNDRNWLNIGPDGTIYLPWQFFAADVADGGSTVAWSTDGGATWDMLEKGDHIPSCYGIGEAALLGARPYVACALADEDFDLSGIGFFHIDTMGATFHEVAVIEEEGAYWPQPVVVADGSLVIAFEDFDDATVWLTRSTNGGLNWTTPVDARDLLAADDGWDYANNYWFEADPWGAVHILLGGTACAGELVLLMGCPRGLVHAAIDPVDWVVLSETVLDEPGPALEDMHVPPPLAPAWGDHYYGIAFTHDAGFMVWTRKQVLEFTTFEPIWADAMPAAE